MKKTLLSLILFAGLFTVACNDINENERYIETDSVDAARAVLIEDFTGQNCVNCPAAHRTLTALVEQYGDAVIPVAIHAGGFGIPVSNTRYTGLMQPEGDTYNNMWNISEWPMGVVDRNSGAVAPSEWPAIVREAIARPASLTISAEAACVDDVIEIALEFRPAADIEGMLQVWILEDGIVARQEDVDLGRINDYVHNHVYRASVNGVGGEAIALESNIHSSTTMSIPVRRETTETRVPENLSVVAFVYNSDGVLQATRCHVTVE